MERKQGVDLSTYWYRKIEEDTAKLNNGQRLALLKAVLVNYCELNTKELEVFLGPEIPSVSDPDLALIYSKAEGKVARHYSALLPKAGTPEHEIPSERRKGFIKDFKSALAGFYKEEEIDELLSCSNPTDDDFVATTLFGVDFPPFRRVRNVYLSAVVKLKMGIAANNGQLRGVRDLTHILFDRQDGDAVFQVERLLGFAPKGPK